MTQITRHRGDVTTITLRETSLHPSDETFDSGLFDIKIQFHK